MIDEHQSDAAHAVLRQEKPRATKGAFWVDHPLATTLAAFAAAASLVGLGLTLTSGGGTTVQIDNSNTQEGDSGVEVTLPAAPTASQTEAELEEEKHVTGAADPTPLPVNRAPDRIAEGVRFSGGLGIDLDSDAPDWSIKDSSFRGIDLYSNGPPQVILTTGMVVAVTGQPGRNACDDMTNERWVGGITADRFKSGQSFCVETDLGGWARIDVDSYNPDTRDVIVDIHYWSS